MANKEIVQQRKQFIKEKRESVPILTDRHYSEDGVLMRVVKGAHSCPHCAFNEVYETQWGKINGKCDDYILYLKCVKCGTKWEQ